MATSEFEEQADQIGRQLPRLDDDRQIAAACRGSANPAALAWLAEASGLSSTTTVVDLGAGLGGPLAWLRARYEAPGVAVDPSEAALRAAAGTFGVIAVRAGAEALPFRGASFDVALMLGVVSVVADPNAALREARRVAGRLGLLDYCATGSSAVHAGGSRFPTPAVLEGWVAAAGWSIEQVEDVGVGAPVRWRDALDEVEVAPDRAEEEVAQAIRSGAIAPIMVAAR